MTNYEYTTGYPMTVYRGAQLLDERLPGWENKIALDVLDMEACDRCVVGQLFADAEFPFERGRAVLNFGGTGAKYGFSPWGRGRWDELTAWWRELISERRAKAA